MHPERIAFETRLEKLLPTPEAAWPEDLQKYYTASSFAQERKQTITLLLSVKNGASEEKARHYLQEVAPMVRSMLPFFTPRKTSRLERIHWPKAFYHHQLTPQDRALLTNPTTEQLTERLYQNIFALGQPRLIALADDPLGFTQAKLLAYLTDLPYYIDHNRIWLRSSEPSLLIIGTIATEKLPLGQGELAKRLTEIQDLVQQKAANRHLTVRMLAAGLPSLTDAAAQQSQADFSRIGLISTIALLLFAYAAFGQVRLILAISLVLGTSVGVGLLTGWAFFGELHTITLVMGLTIIGVAFDYCAHWWLSGSRAPTDELLGRRNRFIPTLLGAAASSLTAYATFMITPLPGLTQMAFVTSVTLITTLWLIYTWGASFPSLFPVRRPRLRLTWMNLCQKYPSWTTLSTRARIVVIGILFLLLLPLPWTKWASGLKDLQAVPLTLLQEHQAMEKRLGLFSTQQYFLVKGATLDEALRRTQRALRHIQKRVPTVRVDSLATYLPTQAQQAQNYQAIDNAYQTIAPTLASLGIKTTPEVTPWITLQTLKESPLEALSSRYVAYNGSDAVLLKILIHGITPENITRLSTYQARNVYWVDRTAALHKNLEKARDRILWGLAFALTAIMLFWRNNWHQIGATVLGILFAASLHAALGWPITLFTSLAFVFIVGLGIDYTLFLRNHQGGARTLFSIFVSAATSMISFGALLFSATPAFASFGAAIACGLATIALCTPLWFTRCR